MIRRSTNINFQECIKKVEGIVGKKFELQYASRCNKNKFLGEYQILKFTPYENPIFHYTDEIAEMQKIPITVECGIVNVRLTNTRAYNNCEFGLKVFIDLKTSKIRISTVMQNGRFLRCYKFGDIE